MHTSALRPAHSRHRIRWRAVSIVACAALLVGTACRKDAPLGPAGPPEDARLEGQLDGAPFLATATADVMVTSGAPSTLVLWAKRSKAAPQPEEWLRISIAFDGVGTYELDETHVQLWQVQGDILVGFYEGSVPNPGEFVISEYEGTGGVMRASFRFWLTPTEPSMPQEPIEFSEGVLAVRIGPPPPPRGY